MKKRFNEKSFLLFSFYQAKPCHRHLNRVKSLMFPSKFRPFIPLCDSEGYYLALQCHQSSRHCWCVDKNGNMKPGTKTKGPIHCGKFKECVFGWQITQKGTTSKVKQKHTTFTLGYPEWYH